MQFLLQSDEVNDVGDTLQKSVEETNIGLVRNVWKVRGKF